MIDTSVAIQVLPQVESDKVFEVVEAVITHIKSTGLPYVVGPFETTIEGEYDELMKLVRDCQLIACEKGAPSVMSYVKINYKPVDGVWTIAEKTDKFK